MRKASAYVKNGANKEVIYISSQENKSKMRLKQIFKNISLNYCH